jgi:hypothetical protein
MAFMGRRWGRYEFGIAAGLGVNAAALLTTFAVFTKSVPMHGIIRDLPVFGEDAAALIWLLFFLWPENQIAVPAKPVSPTVLQEAKEWEEVLRRSLKREKPED